MKLRAVQVVVVLLSCTFLVGCDVLPKQSPQLIVADGETYVACHGWVWVTPEGGGLFGGGGTFKLTYTDVAGLSHFLRGLKKVEISDPPKMVQAPMPLNPTLTTTDGTPVKEGYSYRWPDGSQARYLNGKWESVQVPSGVCSQTPPTRVTPPRPSAADPSVPISPIPRPQ